MTNKTIRLTMAQALARFMTRQMTLIDGNKVPIFGGVFAIFGHGNVAGFGEADNLGGATLAVFELETAQEVLDKEGVYDLINVVGREGVAPSELRASVAAVLPEGMEAVTSTTVADEASDTLQEGLGFFRTALLVFAMIALFAACAMFWAGFEQAGASFNLFAERHTDRDILGWQMPAGVLQAVNPLFIIIFAPVFAGIWVNLGRRNLDPSAPAEKQAPEWTYGPFAGRICGAPVVSGDQLLVTDEGGQVTGLDAKTGGVLWRVRLGRGAIPAAAATPIAPGRLLVPLRDGAVMQCPLPQTPPAAVAGAQT